MLAGVHVEHHGGRLSALHVEELGEEHSVAGIALLLGDSGFETGKGGLAGEVGAGVGRPSDRELEGGIVAQSGGVVGVFVARGDLIDALAKQFEEGVVNAGWAARIVEAGDDALCELEVTVELGEKKEAAVGGEGAAGEIDVDRFARKQRKREHGLRMRHRRMFPFCAFSWSLNLLYARQAKHPPSFWGGPIDHAAVDSGMW
jgi:hypothetical protein